MNARRLIETLVGLSFLLLSLMLLFDAWEVALVMAIIGIGFLAHQAVLGRQARLARPAPVERRRPDAAQWAQNADWSRMTKAAGEQIATVLQASVRAAQRNGLEAGFEEFGRQVERAVNQAQRGSSPEPTPEYEPAPPVRAKPARPRRAKLVELGNDEAYAHAVDAARAAGLELSRTAVLPVDVGLIAFLPGGERAIHRTTPVEPDAEFIQPFVQLNMPTRAVGRIRYELVDRDGQAVFIHEDYETLDRGVNLLTPPARLRTHAGMARYGDWRLLVSADGVPLLNHSFGWAEDPREKLRRHLREDGELTPEARNILDDDLSGPSMSLDDLLGAQDDAGSAQAARRR